MIDLRYWPTPNGWKISIALEELSLPYTVKTVNIGRGEQFTPEFLAISPNNRMPAIVDDQPLGGGAPLAIFESGAILLYLAEKTGKLAPTGVRERYDVMQWLMWQMAGLGPMMGQANHFRHYAAGKSEYATTRYTDEVHRLFGVLETRLRGRDYLAGAYSIADIASFSWSLGYERAGIDLAEFENVARWQAAIKARPAVTRGLAVGKELRAPTMDDKAKEVLFGQRART